MSNAPFPEHPSEQRPASPNVTGATLQTWERVIQERKQAEDAFRQSEARARENLAELEHVYATAPVGLALLGTDLRLLRINDVLAAIDGLPVADHLGHTLGEILPNVANVVEPVLRSVVQSGEPALEIELRTSTRVRESIVAVMSAHPLKDENGRVKGVSVVVQDITARKRVEEALRESDARAKESLAELEHIYATAPVGLALYDTDLRRVRINHVLSAINGLPIADLIGRTLSEALPDVATQVEPVLRSVVQSGQPALNVEVHTKTPAMEFLVGLLSAHPVKDDTGQVKGVSVVVQDITARKRAEVALRESEQRLASILGSAMDAIVVVDDRLVVQMFNAAAEKVFRCAASDAAGKPFQHFATSTFVALLSDCLSGSADDDAARRVRWAPQGLTARRATGEEFPVEATLSRVALPENTLLTIILRDINERRRAEAELRRLRLEHVYLQEEVLGEAKSGDLVGRSPALRKVLEEVEQCAATDATVLLTGETGTGKELLARQIHLRSARRDRIMVSVNCAALPAGLIESELFGHEKGAFTGALTQRLGRFELADGGTIFLDEIGDLPLELQAKLLRVLQEGEFERVGRSKILQTDVRVIAATHRDLHAAVEAKTFRADLFYRLNVFPIHIPPLRERPEDIPLLAQHFLAACARRIGKRIERIPAETMNSLLSYAWPGNVRELQNVVERGMILSRGDVLELGEWRRPAAAVESSKGSRTLQDVERDHILRTLEETNWRVSGPQGAAAILGMKPSTLDSRMRKLRIKRPAI